MYTTFELLDGTLPRLNGDSFVQLIDQNIDIKARELELLDYRLSADLNLAHNQPSAVECLSGRNHQLLLVSPTLAGITQVRINFFHDPPRRAELALYGQTLSEILLKKPPLLSHRPSRGLKLRLQHTTTFGQMFLLASDPVQCHRRRFLRASPGFDFERNILSQVTILLCPRASIRQALLMRLAHPLQLFP